MKLISKIAAGAALLGAITAAQAEQMIFGATVEPIMNLEVDGRILPAEALLNNGAALSIPLVSSPTVGSFRVTTNVVKWNVKMSLANKGTLKTWAGATLNTDVAAAAGQLGLLATPLIIVPTSVDGDVTNVTATTGVVAVAAGVVGLAAGAAGASPAATAITPAAVAFGLAGADVIDLTAIDATYINGGFFNIKKNTIAFDVRTHLGGKSVTALAGTYTETLNLTLYGSY